MPPKNKKQLEQQARRLEQQKRLRQQEQRRLQQIQRIKYAYENLTPTNLILPFTKQLISDFFDQPQEYIAQKLKKNILASVAEKKQSKKSTLGTFAAGLQKKLQQTNKEQDRQGNHQQPQRSQSPSPSQQFPSLQSELTQNNEKLLKQLIKELQYVLKNSLKLFGLLKNQKDVLDNVNNDKIQKARVICGIFMQVFLNRSQSNQRKDKRSDQALLKQILLKHSQQKNPSQQIKIFSAQDLPNVLRFFKANYFDHFLILHKYTHFKPKRQVQKSSFIYIATPSIQYNDNNTVFVDLSPPPPPVVQVEKDEKVDEIQKQKQKQKDIKKDVVPQKKGKVTKK